MFFYALTSAGFWEWCWNWSLKGKGFNNPRRGLADVSASENTVWSLLLYKVILSLENFRKTLWKSHFCITYTGAQKHEEFEGFKNACSRAKTYFILMSLN